MAGDPKSSVEHDMMKDFDEIDRVYRETGIIPDHKVDSVLRLLSKLVSIPAVAKLSNVPEAVVTEIAKAHRGELEEHIEAERQDLADRLTALEAKICEPQKPSAGRLRDGEASTIRRMLTEHGFSTQFIAEQLDVPVETVEQFAAELRLSIIDQVPRPILDLVRELHAAEQGSPDHAKLSEVVRKLAAEANMVLFRMATNRLAAEIPPGAFDDMDLDVGENIEGYAPVDIEIGLQGKKNPDL